MQRREPESEPPGDNDQDSGPDVELINYYRSLARRMLPSTSDSFTYPVPPSSRYPLRSLDRMTSSDSDSLFWNAALLHTDQSLSAHQRTTQNSTEHPSSFLAAFWEPVEPPAARQRRRRELPKAPLRPYKCHEVQAVCDES